MSTERKNYEEKRIYVANGKRVGQYDLVNFALCLSKLPKELIYEYQGKKYINLTIGANKEISKYGKTHAIWVNEFKPEEKQEAQPTHENKPEPGTIEDLERPGTDLDDINNLPF